MKKFIVSFLAYILAFSAYACSIDFTIELQTFGENVTVELRSGAPGRSHLVTSRRSQGGKVRFGGLCAGGYFLAIGDEDDVSVTPVRHFEDDHDYSSRIAVQRGSGNVSKQSRKAL